MARQRLSIIIPTYNRPSILPRAVRSALDACPEGSEIIVVDDRSDTAEAALHALAADARLRIVTNEGEKGAAGARNFGVGLARGDVIIFLDDDDEILRDYPERVLAASERGDAEFGFASALVVEHGIAGEGPPTVETWKALDRGIIPPTIHLRHKMPGLGYGFWVRKRVFDDIGGICAELVVDEDGDFVCRLYGHGYACWFEQVPGMRLHRAYQTGDHVAPQLSRSTDPAVDARCRILTFRRNEQWFAPRSSARWFLIRRVLRYSARAQLDGVAREFLHEIRPLDWRIRGWLFWKLKQASAARHRRRRS
jgi:glycosyltransferase involved in cell wall biosynthesis